LMTSVPLAFGLPALTAPASVTVPVEVPGAGWP